MKKILLILFCFSHFAIAQISGGGVKQLNGLWTPIQSFLVDTTYATSPVFVSSGTTHTLRIPMNRLAKVSDSTIVSAGTYITAPYVGHTVTVNVDTTKTFNKLVSNVVTGSNIFTARQYLTSARVDTIVGNNSRVYILDTLFLGNKDTPSDGILRLNDASSGFEAIIHAGAYSYDQEVIIPDFTETQSYFALTDLSGNFTVNGLFRQTTLNPSTVPYHLTDATGLTNSPITISVGGDAVITNDSLKVGASGTGVLTAGAISGTSLNLSNNFLIGTAASASTNIIQGATPYLVLKNNSETTSGLVVYDLQDTTQRGFFSYGAGDNLVTIGNSTATSIQLDNNGNVILGATSNAVYPNITAAIDLGLAPTAGNKEWDSLYVQDIKASGTISSGAITSTGKISPNSVTTEGDGVVSTPDTVVWTARATSIGSQNFLNTATGHLYRVTYYLHTTTTGTGTVLVSFSWNDGAAKTSSSATADLTSTGNTGLAAGSQMIYVSSGTPSWTTTVAGGGSTERYALRMVLERVY